ncbi:MAG: hypothetical protein H6745_04305 [Deltaproteobacteria bacterium]|nr:hypothetical protein [Deltaproteobacteria bacterium]
MGAARGGGDGAEADDEPGVEGGLEDGVGAGDGLIPARPDLDAEEIARHAPGRALLAGDARRACAAGAAVEGLRDR